MYDVTIIGAGASGVMCTLALKEKNKSAFLAFFFLA